MPALPHGTESGRRARCLAGKMPALPHGTESGRRARCLAGKMPALPLRTESGRLARCLAGKMPALPHGTESGRRARCLAGKMPALPHGTESGSLARCLAGKMPALPHGTESGRLARCLAGKMPALPHGTEGGRLARCLAGKMPAFPHGTEGGRRARCPASKMPALPFRTENGRLARCLAGKMPALPHGTESGSLARCLAGKMPALRAVVYPKLSSGYNMLRDSRTIRRRSFLKTAAAATAAATVSGRLRAAPAPARAPLTKARLDEILAEPVLKTDFVQRPVMVGSVELLRHGRVYLLRSRSQDGVEAITVPNPARMAETYPIFLKNILPVFVKKDARQLESLLWDVYRHGSNYKLQGIALWAGVAAIEMALLELLGQTAQRPLADFFGGARQRDIAVYYASGNRGNRPEAEVEYLQRLIAESGARAVKFRLGGRMSRNADSLPGRTEALIPMARKALGDEITLYADANSSYDALEGIRIGRLMEAHGYGLYEEPCPFDWIWETKEVADALTIPVAGGEQEFSLRRWQWAIEHRGLDIVQPDLHYGGGYIRATQVARMAAAAGMSVVPHMSGGGLGYLDVVHFASFTPNIGPFMEFKGNTDLPIECPTSTLKCERGVVRCPTGPGFGVRVDPGYVNRAQPVPIA